MYIDNVTPTGIIQTREIYTRDCYSSIEVSLHREARIISQKLRQFCIIEYKSRDRNLRKKHIRREICLNKI